MLELPLSDRIRHIFLHQRPHVSISVSAALLGWSRREMNDAIAAGEIETSETPLGQWIWREELMAKMLELWGHEIIEDALGDHAERVLPRALLLAELRARVPRYQIAMLEYFAARDQMTVSNVLARELDGVASSHAPELEAAIQDFAHAFAWPEGSEAPAC